jgi:RimJ/RimL family protein N-acetyltransferase
VELVTLPDNEGSQRVATKAGFQQEGLVLLQIRDERHEECVLFSLPAEALDRSESGTAGI